MDSLLFWEDSEAIVVSIPIFGTGPSVYRGLRTCNKALNFHMCTLMFVPELWTICSKQDIYYNCCGLNKYNRTVIWVVVYVKLLHAFHTIFTSILIIQHIDCAITSWIYNTSWTLSLHVFKDILTKIYNKTEKTMHAYSSIFTWRLADRRTTKEDNFLVRYIIVEHYCKYWYHRMIYSGS